MRIDSSFQPDERCIAFTVASRRMAHRLHEYREGGYSTTASWWCSNRNAALNHCQNVRSCVGAR